MEAQLGQNPRSLSVPKTIRGGQTAELEVERSQNNPNDISSESEASEVSVRLV